MATLPFALNPELTAQRNKANAQFGAVRAKETQSVDELKAQNLAQKSIQVGDMMPSFLLPNAVQKLISSSELNKGGLVINFYRGSWCPFCNLELNALRKILPQIRSYGADFVAISPETPDNSLTMVQKHNLEFEVLSDTENSLAKQIGIAFEVPNYLVKVYQSFGLNLDEVNGSIKFELPLPATYVIDKTGKVHFAFADEDFTVRAEPSDILKTLQKLA